MQATLKKSTLFFPSNPVPFNGQNYWKQKGSGTSDQLLLRLWNKFRKIPLLVIINLPSLMMWYEKVVELFQKLCIQIYASQCMISKVITNLDSSKAFGPNCIPVVVLKN